MKNLRFNKFGTVDCEIDHEKYGTIPTTLDDEESKELIDSGVDIAEYIEPEKTLNDIREERTPLLKLYVDKYTPLWWSVLTTAQKDEVTAYRIALMDITEQDPTDVTWPTPPSF
jgi:hypothetical protein